MLERDDLIRLFKRQCKEMAWIKKHFPNNQIEIVYREKQRKTYKPTFGDFLLASATWGHPPIKGIPKNSYRKTVRTERELEKIDWEILAGVTLPEQWPRQILDQLRANKNEPLLFPDSLKRWHINRLNHPFWRIGLPYRLFTTPDDNHIRMYIVSEAPQSPSK